MKKNNALPSPEREQQSVIATDKTSLSEIYYTIREAFLSRVF